MALRPLSTIPHNNVELLSKSVVRPSPEQLAALRGQRLRGGSKHSSSDIRDALSLGALQAERDKQNRLLNSYKYDVDIFAMVRQVMRRMPPWTLTEAVPGQGNEQNKAALTNFFHLPDGENTCQQIVRCTVARMKMLGKAHWLMRRLVDDGQPDSPQAMALQRQVVNVLSKQLGVDEAEAETAMRDLLGANAPIGFELLSGAIRYNSKERVWEQSVSQYGTTKKYAAADVVEFKVMDPAGGVMSELERLEPWSDASCRVFKLNSDAVKTGGMADLLIVLYGSNKKEVERLEALMEDRADPARTEDVWLPMVTHATAPEGQRVGVEQVELSRRGRESLHLEFDKQLRVRKAGGTGVPLQAVGEWQQVNRANMETADYILMQHEVMPWCEDFSEQVNAQVLVEMLGITDWQFGFEAVDVRGQEFAHTQDTDELKNGLLTPYDYWVKVHGEERAEAMLEEVKKAGVEEQAVKIPWQLSGGKWSPITEQVPVYLKTGAAAAAAEEAAAAAAPPPKKDAAEEGDEGAQSGGTERSQPIAASTGDGGATPDEMQKTLDTWQERSTSAFRKTGVAYDPQADASAYRRLPQQMYLALNKSLFNCTSVPEISSVFVDGRSVLRMASQKLEKVMAPPHVLRALSGAIDEVFAAREADAMQVVADRLRGEGSEFDTEAEDAKEE